MNYNDVVVGMIRSDNGTSKPILVIVEHVGLVFRTPGDGRSRSDEENAILKLQSRCHVSLAWPECTNTRYNHTKKGN